MEYLVSYQKWWWGLQPEWRRLDDGTLKQEVPDTGEDWEGLRQGGRNGFFMVILAFSWLVEMANGDVDDVGLHGTLDDVLWVVKCMADMPATHSTA